MLVHARWGQGSEGFEEGERRERKRKRRLLDKFSFGSGGGRRMLRVEGSRFAVVFVNHVDWFVLSASMLR